MSAESAPRRDAEVFIALVKAAGTSLKPVEHALRDALNRVRYECHPIKLITEVTVQERWADPKSAHPDDLLQHQMDVGNEFRKVIEDKAAMAMAAVRAIRRARKDLGGDEHVPRSRAAYLINSLKKPQEIELLRQIYGSNLFVVSVYESRDAREANLISKFAQARCNWDARRQRSRANDLILRDEQEAGLPYGQNFSETFPRADVFVDAGNSAHMRQSLNRFVELVFGHPCRTPTRDEYAMFLAHGAALRSSADRQVGAALARDGDVVATGTNEVPKAGGGQYWEEDGETSDQRDYFRAFNSSDAMTNAILADLFERLMSAGWLGGAPTADAAALTKEFREKLKGPQPKGGQIDITSSLAEKARVFQVIEYIRAVHAEVSAMLMAARNGIPVAGTTLYSTTFPCHECAKNIVAAGVARVVFIEPYPKSKVAQLYNDSVSLEAPAPNRVCFQPFVGVAPRAYFSLFTGSGRDGPRWEDARLVAHPRLASPSALYVESERDYVSALKKRYGAAHLCWDETPMASAADAGGTASSR